MNAIEIENLGKKFQLAQMDSTSLWGSVCNLFKKSSQEEFWALKDITFSVKREEMFGIIGANGSGKSTLLRILSGISPPTEGSVKMNGRVSALLELGTGFHRDF